MVTGTLASIRQGLVRVGVQSTTPPNGTTTTAQNGTTTTPPNGTGHLHEATKTIHIPVDLVVLSLATIALAYVVARATDWVLTETADRLLAARFRLTLLIPVAKFVIYAVAVAFVLTNVVRPSPDQLVAFAGLFGAALGFGLKDLVADVFGGLVLVAEQPYQIGDKVQIGEYYGEVVDIGIRSTTLDTPNDTRVTVPNYLFFDESIANANAGRAEMLVTVEFYIDPDSDATEAREIVEDALYTSQYVYVTDDLPVEVIVEDDLHYRTLTGKAYVNDLRNEFQFKTDVTERVFTEFAERGIQSPKMSPGAVEPSAGE